MPMRDNNFCILILAAVACLVSQVQASAAKCTPHPTPGPYGYYGDLWCNSDTKDAAPKRSRNRDRGAARKSKPSSTRQVETHKTTTRRKEAKEEIRQQEPKKEQEEARKTEDRLPTEVERRSADQREAVTAIPADESDIIGAEAGILPPGRRVAFVVGINTYKDLPPQNQLQRAVGDAKLMRAAFRKLGFEVIPVSDDVTRREFAQAWQKYLKAIEPGSTAAFFFAGHGVQLQGANYLLPSDVPAIQVDSPELLKLEALDFTQLYSDILARKPKVSFLILDACRDNPFAQRYGRSVGGMRGLTTVKPIEGSFVLYSANADEQALDRLPDDPPDEENSVFTRTLVPVLLKPGVALQEVARRVRRRVAELAKRVGHKQWPSYYDGLTGNVYLAGVSEPAATAEGTAPEETAR
jgi:Caspase domain